LQTERLEALSLSPRAILNAAIAIPVGFMFSRPSSLALASFKV
jgi:hypothetical protein